MSSSTKSPCAACKFRRQKCTQECIFAPYFQPDDSQKFADVHKVFGASNVGKLLNEIDTSQREDAVNSLAYEAKARLLDPVYGCVGAISILQQRLKQLQHDLHVAKKELCAYIGPQAMVPTLQPPAVYLQHFGNASSAALMQPNMMTPMMGIPTAPVGSASHGEQQLVMKEPQKQQVFEAQQQLAAAVAAREHEKMFAGYEQQQGKQQEIARFDNGFEGADSVTATGINQMTTADTMSPSLAVGSFENPYQIQTQQQEHHHHHHHHHLFSHGGQMHQLQAETLFLAQQNQQQRSESEERGSIADIYLQHTSEQQRKKERKKEKSALGIGVPIDAELLALEQHALESFRDRNWYLGLQFSLFG